MSHEFWPELTIETPSPWERAHNRTCMECATGGRCMEAVKEHFKSAVIDIPEVRQHATKPEPEAGSIEWLKIRPDDDPFPVYDLGGEG